MIMTLLGALTILTTFDTAFTHDAVVSMRKSYVPEELALLARIAPGGHHLEAIFMRPACSGSGATFKRQVQLFSSGTPSTAARYFFSICRDSNNRL